MAKYQIGIWGQYGDPGTRIADGQAVRTTIITRELEKRYGKAVYTRTVNTGLYERLYGEVGGRS